MLALPKSASRDPGPILTLASNMKELYCMFMGGKSRQAPEVTNLTKHKSLMLF